MAFDIEMIRAVYARLGERVAAARRVVGKPLTLSQLVKQGPVIVAFFPKAFTGG